jgi:hypothetical protein
LELSCSQLNCNRWIFWPFCLSLIIERAFSGGEIISVSLSWENSRSCDSLGHLLSRLKVIEFQGNPNLKWRTTVGVHPFYADPVHDFYLLQRFRYGLIVPSGLLMKRFPQVSTYLLCKQLCSQSNTLSYGYIYEYICDQYKRAIVFTKSSTSSGVTISKLY